ncbi:MAG TPA: alpha-glucosidase/alpha-galactosidase [Limnochordia bacterium]|nr:alpha-glucosidase/alpha-galactosidase [Limnochordia bacterium]
MKFTFIGAGSYTFTRRLVGDIFLEPAFADITIALMDVDTQKLGYMREIVEKMAAHNGVRAQVLATTDRRAALQGADVVVTTIRVGRLEDIRADHALPAAAGMRQTVGDTVGPGGVFYGVRNTAVLLEICREMEQLCPEALLLNYTNPMAIAMSVLQRGSATRSIGLCHSVQHTLEQLCRILDVPPDEVRYQCGGVNHTAWFLRLEHRGRDLYPELHRLAQQPEVFAKDPVRFDLMQRFDLFPTESSHHHAEYHPYYLHADEECERLGLRYNHNIERFTPEVHGQKTLQGLRDLAAQADVATLKRSVEYFTAIVKAAFTDEPVRVYGNLLNRGLIDNLPPDAAVEVPVYVDRNGFNPTAIGTLPGGAAARTAAVAHHQVLAAEGILRKDLRLIREAILVDPNTSASLTVRQAEAMIDALIEQNRPYLEGYRDSRRSVYFGGGERGGQAAS